MINLPKLTQEENGLLNNLLDKYGAKAFLEACYELVMEEQEGGNNDNA